MRSVHYFPVGILMFVLTACAAGEAQKPAAKEPSPAVVKFLSPATVDVLKKGEKVEVFRVKNRRSDEKKETARTIGGYVISAEGKVQDKAFATRLANVLLDEKTYDFNSAKGCEFDPGVAYRIWSGDKAVEVALCFICSELAVFAPMSPDGSVRSAMEDFDNARPALVKLATEAFPEDKEIQGLGEDK